MENKEEKNTRTMEDIGEVKGELVIGKPRFDKKTKVEIVRSDISPTRENKKDVKGAEFIPIIWSVQMKHNENMFTEKFSGIRIYPETGGNRLYVSEKSSAGRVLRCMKESGCEINGLDEIEMQIIGKTAKVISEDWSIGDDKGFKNIIVDLDL